MKKKIQIYSIKELNFVVIQNDKILVIFLCLQAFQAKLQLFKIIECCYSAQAVENFFWQLFN